MSADFSISPAAAAVLARTFTTKKLRGHNDRSLADDAEFIRAASDKDVASYAELAELTGMEEEDAQALLNKLRAAARKYIDEDAKEAQEQMRNWKGGTPAQNIAFARTCEEVAKTVELADIVLSIPRYAKRSYTRKAGGKRKKVSGFEAQMAAQLSKLEYETAQREAQQRENEALAAMSR